VYTHYGPNDACRSIDLPSIAITARHTVSWATPNSGIKLKKFNIQETMALQTFPADYCIPLTLQHTIRGLGNSFPPCIAKRFFSFIQEM